MNTNVLPRETHTGTLHIGDVELPCAVLDNQMRVISRRGFNASFGQNEQNVVSSENGVAQMPRFLAAKNLNPFIPADFAESHELISYQPKQGGRTGTGYPAIMLVDVSEIVMRAFQEGALHASQLPLVHSASRLLSALAKVGVTALIDEACGYLPQPTDYAKQLEQELHKQTPPAHPAYVDHLERENAQLHVHVKTATRLMGQLSDRQTKLELKYGKLELRQQLAIKAAAEKPRDLLGTRAIADYLGVKMETFRSWYKGHHDLLQLAKFQNGHLMWPAAEVDEWWKTNAVPKQRQQREERGCSALMFADACLQPVSPDANEGTSGSDLYTAYVSFCKEKKMTPLTNTRFAQRLQEQLSKVRKSAGIFWFVRVVN